MILAATAGDAGGALLHIVVLLLAAKLAVEVGERLGVPAVVAEIVAGIVVGPSALGWVEAGDVLRTLGELGVILLLLEVGLEMDLVGLRAVGRTSLFVALAGVVLPFAGGFVVTDALGYTTNTALFAGAALTATSVGITARVFGDLRALASIEARTVLAAAVADDVLGLVILTVMVRVVSEGSLSLLSAGQVLVVAVGFLAVTTAAGLRLAPRTFAVVQRHARTPGTFVAVSLAFTLAFALLASRAGLAPIVGAFVAGLALARSEHAPRIKRELMPLGHVFIPVFFLQIGIDADIAAMADPGVLAVAGALLVVAAAGKFGAAAGALGAQGDKALIGFGMLPRGEVGLIFAGLGLAEGVLDADLYAALILVVLSTTLAAPPLLRWRLGGVRVRADVVSGDPRPAHGWLAVHDGVVDLAANPPPAVALHVALQAAAAATAARPGSALLEWLAAVRDAPMDWDAEATAELFALLRHGTPRSWRLLEAAGVMERALPELAAVVRARRSDPFHLDPAGLMSWSVVDRVHEIVAPGGDERAGAEYRLLRSSEPLLLAALLVDAAPASTEAAGVAEQLCRRVGVTPEVERHAVALVADASLLRAAAARPDSLDERSVVHLAAHLGTPERLRSLYLLTLAVGGLAARERDRLDELHDSVLAALSAGDRGDAPPRPLAEQRRAAAAGRAGAELAGERLAHAPTALVLSEGADDLARLAALAEPRPGRREVRVEVHPGRCEREWRVDVACRDRPGLLARVAGALAGEKLAVVSATAATWPDGGAVQSFHVRANTAPDDNRLPRTIAAALTGPLPDPGIPAAKVCFDAEASPWYTICEVEAPDSTGLLAALASGFAACGVSIHSARITTHAGVATDWFELSDAAGAKLAPASHEQVAMVVRGEQAARRRPSWRRRHSPA